MGLRDQYTTFTSGRNKRRGSLTDQFFSKRKKRQEEEQEKARQVDTNDYDKLYADAKARATLGVTESVNRQMAGRETMPIQPPPGAFHPQPDRDQYGNLLPPVLASPRTTAEMGIDPSRHVKPAYRSPDERASDAYWQERYAREQQERGAQIQQDEAAAAEARRTEFLPQVDMLPATPQGPDPLAGVPERQYTPEEIQQREFDLLQSQAAEDLAALPPEPPTPQETYEAEVARARGELGQLDLQERPIEGLSDRAWSSVRGTLGFLGLPSTLRDEEVRRNTEEAVLNLWDGPEGGSVGPALASFYSGGGGPGSAVDATLGLLVATWPPEYLKDWLRAKAAGETDVPDIWAPGHSLMPGDVEKFDGSWKKYKRTFVDHPVMSWAPDVAMLGVSALPRAARVVAAWVSKNGGSMRASIKAGLDSAQQTRIAQAAATPPLKPFEAGGAQKASRYPRSDTVPQSGLKVAGDVPDPGAVPPKWGVEYPRETTTLPDRPVTRQAARNETGFGLPGPGQRVGQTTPKKEFAKIDADAIAAQVSAKVQGKVPLTDDEILQVWKEHQRESGIADKIGFADQPLTDDEILKVWKDHKATTRPVERLTDGEVLQTWREHKTASDPVPIERLTDDEVIGVWKEHTAIEKKIKRAEGTLKRSKKPETRARIEKDIEKLRGQMPEVPATKKAPVVDPPPAPPKAKVVEPAAIPVVEAPKPKGKPLSGTRRASRQRNELVDSMADDEVVQAWKQLEAPQYADAAGRGDPIGKITPIGKGKYRVFFPATGRSSTKTLPAMKKRLKGVEARILRQAEQAAAKAVPLSAKKKAPVAPPAGKPASIPSQFTKKMHSDLKKRGYDVSPRKNMPPQDAWDIINKGPVKKPKPDTMARKLGGPKGAPSEVPGIVGATTQKTAAGIAPSRPVAGADTAPLLAPRALAEETQNLMGLPIAKSYGKGGQRSGGASGWYNTRTGLLVVKDPRDLPSMFHEVGHGLVETKKSLVLAKMPAKVKTELTNFGARTFGHWDALNEGTVEAIANHLAFNNTSTLLPEFTKWFDKFFKKIPGLERVQQLAARRRMATGAERFAGQTAPGKLPAPKRSTRLALASKVVDDTRPMTQFYEDAKMMEIDEVLRADYKAFNTRGTSGKRVGSLLTEGNYTGSQVYNVKGFGEISKDLLKVSGGKVQGEAIREFVLWRRAKRAINLHTAQKATVARADGKAVEVTRQAKATPWTGTTEPEEFIASMEKKYSSAAMDQASKDFNKMRDVLLKEAVREDFITKEIADMWRKTDEFWIPFTREMKRKKSFADVLDDLSGGVPAKGRGGVPKMAGSLDYMMKEELRSVEESFASFAAAIDRQAIDRRFADSMRARGASGKYFQEGPFPLASPEISARVKDFEAHLASKGLPNAQALKEYESTLVAIETMSGKHGPKLVWKEGGKWRSATVSQDVANMSRSVPAAAKGMWGQSADAVGKMTSLWKAGIIYGPKFIYNEFIRNPLQALFKGGIIGLEGFETGFKGKGLGAFKPKVGRGIKALKMGYSDQSMRVLKDKIVDVIAKQFPWVSKLGTEAGERAYSEMVLKWYEGAGVSVSGHYKTGKTLHGMYGKKVFGTKHISSGVRGYKDVASSVDGMVRKGHFREALEHAGYSKKLFEAGTMPTELQLLKAIRMARGGIVNFSMSGGLAREFNKLYGFLTANIAATDDMYRHFRGKGEVSKAEAAFNALQVGVPLGVMNWYTNKDDPTYRDATPQERAAHYRIPNPFGGEPIRIAKAHQLSMISTITELALDSMVNGKDAIMDKDELVGLLNTLVPYGGLEIFNPKGGWKEFSRFTPSVGRPAHEAQTGYATFPQSPIVNPAVEAFSPASKQTRPYTKEVYKAFAEYVGEDSFSPQKLQHFFEGTFGVFAKVGGAAASALLPEPKTEGKGRGRRKEEGRRTITEFIGITSVMGRSGKAARAVYSTVNRLQGEQNSGDKAVKATARKRLKLINTFMDLRIRPLQDQAAGEPNAEKKKVLYDKVRLQFKNLQEIM